MATSCPPGGHGLDRPTRRVDASGLCGARIARTLRARIEVQPPVDRTVETIRDEWRAATDEREDAIFNPDLEVRIQALRLEHATAMAARRSEIQDTWARRAKVH